MNVPARASANGVTGGPTADGDVLARAELLRGLPREALEELARLSRRVSLRAGDVLCREGDASDDFFVLQSGRCEVIKRHAGGGYEEVIFVAEAGATLGELALLDPAPRAATIRATEDAELWAMPLEAVRALIQSNSERYPFLALTNELQRRLATRIREMNYEAIELLRARASHLEERAQASAFIVFLVSILCVFMFVTSWLASRAKDAAGTTALTGPIMIVLVATLVYPIRRFALPWSFYGVTTRNWRRSLRDGVLFALPLLLLATGVKQMAMGAHPEFADLPLFDLTHSLAAAYDGDATSAWWHFVFYNAAYVLLIVPLQEFISRGMLQGLLERLIESKHRTALAVLVSNLVFSAFHLYLSVGIALATFGLGLYLGFVYSRTRNLLGACVLHALVGTWCLSIVRIHPLVS